MYQELVARAAALIRDDYDKEPPPATEEALAILCQRTRDEMHEDLPDGYLNFLRVPDGYAAVLGPDAPQGASKQGTKAWTDPLRAHITAIDLAALSKPETGGRWLLKPWKLPRYDKWYWGSGDRMDKSLAGR